MTCDICGNQIEELDGFTAMERGTDYDYVALCEECYDELEYPT